MVRSLRGSDLGLGASVDYIDGGEVISDGKVRKLYGTNYRKLQTIKGKYE
jgi:hypothetical protein